MTFFRQVKKTNWAVMLRLSSALIKFQEVKKQIKYQSLYSEEQKWITTQRLKEIKHLICEKMERRRQNDHNLCKCTYRYLLLCMKLYVLVRSILLRLCVLNFEMNALCLLFSQNTIRNHEKFVDMFCIFHILIQITGLFICIILMKHL